MTTYWNPWRLRRQVRVLKRVIQSQGRIIRKRADEWWVEVNARARQAAIIEEQAQQIAQLENRLRAIPDRDAIAQWKERAEKGMCRTCRQPLIPPKELTNDNRLSATSYLQETYFDTLTGQLLTNYVPYHSTCPVPRGV